jgi:hypothetical protein
MREHVQGTELAQLLWIPAKNSEEVLEDSPQAVRISEKKFDFGQDGPIGFVSEVV